MLDDKPSLVKKAEEKFTLGTPAHRSYGVAKRDRGHRYGAHIG